MSIIRFDGVSKSYPLYNHALSGFKAALLHPKRTYKAFKRERRLVLKDVSFEVQRGETIGLIGSNGSGKSTSMALIAGVLKPDAGSVTVQGRIAPLLELGAGFHPDLTGRENIVLNAVLLGLTRHEVLSRVGSIIDFSELTDFIDQPVRTYSSGMHARLGFAVAVHLDPDILLIDEILAVGDMHFQSKCQNKFSEFKRQGVTIVLVSHSSETVREICDRVLWIHNGRLAGQGSPSAVLPKYEAFQRGDQVLSVDAAAYLMK